MPLVITSGRLSDAATVQGTAIRYVVRPVVHRSLLELDVTVSFAGEPSGRTPLLMPSDRFGVPRMYRFVRQLEVSAGAVTSQSAGDSVILIEHAPGARLSVRYVLRYDSASVGFVAYGPSVGERHFHVRECVRLLRPPGFRCAAAGLATGTRDDLRLGAAKASARPRDRRGGADRGFLVVPRRVHRIPIPAALGARAAGLRDRMPIVRYGNARRWSTAWRPDVPMRIVVRQHGSERVIEFNPVIGELAVPYFVRRD
ncbi:MAG: hypothetical protein ACREMJ_01330 [Gemmatimonadales bacterium]